MTTKLQFEVVAQNKGKKVYFDAVFHIPNPTWACISVEDRTYTLRVEGRIIAESDTHFKIKTHTFWGGSNTTVIKYPNSDIATKHINPNVQRWYWVDKNKTIFLK